LGVISCIEVATGKVIWQDRLDGEFSASPICAGDAIYCTANTGDVFVVEASDTFKLLARNRLGERTQSTPAITAGRLLFRTDGHLLAVK
jgi:outer membrane protein assembly factor BamB